MDMSLHSYCPALQLSVQNGYSVREMKMGHLAELTYTKTLVASLDRGKRLPENVL